MLSVLWFVDGLLCVEVSGGTDNLLVLFVDFICWVLELLLVKMGIY